jgi:hypothetical protein
MEVCMSTIHDSLEHPILDADGHWAELPPLFSSDIGHVDVPDMGEVNPDFFKGTVVDEQAAEVLARGR